MSMFLVTQCRRSNVETQRIMHAVKVKTASQSSKPAGERGRKVIEVTLNAARRREHWRGWLGKVFCKLLICWDFPAYHHPSSSKRVIWKTENIQWAVALWGKHHVDATGGGAQCLKTAERKHSLKSLLVMHSNAPQAKLQTVWPRQQGTTQCASARKWKL